jgi:hypothetical protein
MRLLDVFRSEDIILSLSPFQGQEDHIIYWIRLAIYVVFQMHPLDDKVTTIVFFLKKNQRSEPRLGGLPKCKKSEYNGFLWWEGRRGTRLMSCGGGEGQVSNSFDYGRRDGMTTTNSC